MFYSFDVSSNCRKISIKEKILSIVSEEADQWVGSAMTYTLFECLKEKVPELLTELVQESVTSRVEKITLADPEQVSL